MGREAGGPADAGTAAIRSAVVLKHKKRTRYGERGTTPSGLDARPALPKLKHKTIYEWAENTDKKKKLEIEVTTNKTPPPNFTFIPIGNPELTNVCKEISRESGALVYIVSATQETSLTDLSDHVHRLGYHFRTQIVEEGIQNVGGHDLAHFQAPQPKFKRKSGPRGDPIPNDQEEINKQADATMRDLFPRIPNTDREIIIRHAFQKGAVFNGKPVVGLQEDLTLSRRVQLAVIAHIRHTHTRYDFLLRETSWENARKIVGALCLDILVRWRGDEETGRDQLDEVLREIVVLDDSDDDDDEEEDDDEDEDESDDDIEEGEISENEQNSPEKVPEVITITSSPVRSPVNANIASNRNNKRLLLSDAVGSATPQSTISSRTRSKTQPSKRSSKRKAKKVRRREQKRARQLQWQEAVNRRNKQSPRPDRGTEQMQLTRSQQTMSPRNNQHSGFAGSANPKISVDTRPYNQSIYAIDDSVYARRRKTVSRQSLHPRGGGVLWPPVIETNAQQLLIPSAHSNGGPSTPIYGDQVNVRSRMETVTSMDKGCGYVSRPVLSRPAPSTEPWTTSGFVTSPRGRPIQERVLPSIEQPTELLSERLERGTPPSPGRRSQVMYPKSETKVRVLPPRSNIVYIDDYEQQPKRRRLVGPGGDPVPVSSVSGEGYRRQLPRVERPSLHDNEPAQFVRVRRIVDGVYRDEELPVIEDDGRKVVRVVRRVPESEVFLRERPDQLPVYIGRRDDDQPYNSNGRPVLPVRKQKPVEYTPSGRVMVQDHPSHVSRMTPNVYNHLSTFSNNSQSHSQAMNSGVSRPLSRHIEQEPRFESTRPLPKVGSMQPSHHLSTERLPPNYPDRGPYGAEALTHQAGFREIPRDELRYVPVDQYGRPLEMIRTPGARDMDAPVHNRLLPCRDDIIVLD